MDTVVSRRNFLRTATGSIGFSWGGIRILAGQTTAQSAETASQLPRLTQPFIYGSAFYRPPNPPASMRREMLKTIRATDIHQSREVTAEQNAVRLTVPFESVSVLQLE
jgi:hypothetical protein